MRHSRYLSAARAARWCTIATTSLASGSLVACDASAPLAPDIAASASVSDAHPSAPAARLIDHDRITGDVRATQRRLERAARGLLYLSESDYPFSYARSRRAAPSPVTPAVVAAAFGFAADAPVEVIPLDAFFARHIERVDPADDVALAQVPAYRRLRETLRRSAHDVRVYRVGTIAIDCLIVGVDRHGHLVGMRTVAIET